MALGDNAILALHDPADNVTVAVTAAVLAGRFVSATTGFQGGPLLDLTTSTSPLTGGNLPQVAPSGAGARVLGVTKWDTVAAGDVVGIYCGGQIVPVVAGGVIAAGAEVESDATGRAVTLAAGKAAGVTLNATAAAGQIAYVKLNT